MGETGLSLRATYDLIHSLEGKKMVTVKKGRNRAITPSDYLHASAFRQVFIQGTPPLQVFAGGKLSILLAIAFRPKKLSQISEETGLKITSVRRLLLDLMHYGLIWREGEEVTLSRSALDAKRFLEDFSKGACMANLEDISKKGILLWNDGLQFLFFSYRTR